MRALLTGAILAASLAGGAMADDARPASGERFVVAQAETGPEAPPLTPGLRTPSGTELAQILGLIMALAIAWRGYAATRRERQEKKDRDRYRDTF